MTQTANLAVGPDGLALIPAVTPLTRLNYFDGKFLRADDLNREQDYFRSLVELSNQAGGAGIVHGFTTRLAGGSLTLTPGLAIDPRGRVLFLPHPATVSVAELIERAREAAAPPAPGTTPAVGESGFAPCEIATVGPPAVVTTFPTDLYLIALAHVEAFCGVEDVYGKLCEEACITSTSHPLRQEGVVVRALPLTLCPPTCDAPWLTARHRRSQVASAYFATERALLGRDMSGARLRLDLWCGGAAAQSGSVVPVGVVSVSGGAVEFFDAWTARRERMEAPPRRFWAWQTMMRPWETFLAQLLHFQCHLHAVLADPGTAPSDGADACAEQDEALREAATLLAEVEKTYVAASAESRCDDLFRPDFLTRISELKARIGSALDDGDAPAGTRILVDGGIVELPPAGYLPVIPGKVDVNAQVRALLGGGVDLRFCSVRPDYVAHALEEAQHLERICLLHGLEDPAAVQEVDVLVPDGAVVEVEVPTGRYFETALAVTFPAIDPPTTDDPTTGEPAEVYEAEVDAIEVDEIEVDEIEVEKDEAPEPRPEIRGASRTERLAGGGAAHHFAGLLVQPVEQIAAGMIRVYDSYSQSFGRKAGGPAIDGLEQGLAQAMGGMKALQTNAVVSGNHSRAPTPALAPAVWMTARCERDPFALGIGESAPVRVEAAVGLGYLGFVAGAQLTLNGDFYCDEKPASGAARRVKGRAWGWAFGHYRLDASGQVTTGSADPVFLPVHAELDLTPSNTGGTLAITITAREGLEITVTTDWDGAPVLATARASIDLLEAVRPELRAVEFAKATLRENPAVAEDANPHHAAAMKALRTIGAALDDEGLRAAAEHLLFPPATPVLTEKRILPTRDWVLFHRRRSSSCDCCQPAAKVAAPPRRYQVYEITSPEPTDVERIRQTFSSGRSVEGFAEVVGVVEFEGGTARLTPATAPLTVRQGWELAMPASSILYGAIAAEGAAMNDAEPLGEQRVARVADLVRSITPLDAAVEFDILPLVPVGLSAQGVDGVILLVTAPKAAAATQRHRVISLPEQATLQEEVRRIQQGQLAAVVADYEGTLGRAVEVEFATGTDAMTPYSLAFLSRAWEGRWPQATVSRGLVVIPAQSAISQAVAESQGTAICAALGGSTPAQAFTAAGDVFGSCQAITFLEPVQRTAPIG